MLSMADPLFVGSSGWERVVCTTGGSALPVVAHEAQSSYRSYGLCGDHVRCGVGVGPCAVWSPSAPVDAH